MVAGHACPAPRRTVSVVIPTWNGEATLAQCLDGVFAQETGDAVDVLVIDSSSTDRTREIAARYPVRLEVIDQRDFDHGDTRNLGVTLTRGELVVFLVQDAYPAGRGWLRALVSNFDDPRVAGAYCRVVPRPQAGERARRAAQSDPCYSRQRVERRIQDRAAYERSDPLQRRLLIDFNNVAACLRRDVWQRLPFARTPFGEDLVWARGALEAGHTIVFDPRAEVVHSHEYDAGGVRRRSAMDGWWNRAYLDRACVASRRDALVMARRAADAEALPAPRSVATAARWLRSAHYHFAQYRGFHEGGRTRDRRPTPRALARTDLHVLFVLHAFPPETMAGTEIVTLSLARELGRRGHRVTVLHRTADAAQPEGTVAEGVYDGLRVLRLARHDRSRTLAATDRDERVDAAFRDLLRREAPDVVHFQHLLHLSANLPQVCRDEGVASVLTVHDFWFRCPKVQLIRDDGRPCAGPPPILGCAACLAGRPDRIDALAVVSRPLARELRALAASSLPARAHRLPGGARLLHLAQVAERPARMMEALLAADFVIAPSRFMKEKMVEAGVPAERLIVSDNGMETAWLETYRPRVPDGRVRFGFVGSLVSYKGLEVLARALALLGDPRAELHVHGDAEGAPEFREVAARARAAAGSSPSVVFHGAFTPSRLGAVLGSIDVLVVPSLWYENSPLTIHEAFQARLPVLASNHGGLRELLREGKGGLLFQAGDAADLARVMRRLLDDPTLAGRLAAAAPAVKSVALAAAEMEVKYRQAIGLREAEGASPWPDVRPRVSTDAGAPALSVVIPTLDGRELLAECLEGLARQDYPRDRVEVVVVDNASTDGSVDWLRERHPDVRIVALETNLGFAEPCNRGVQAAGGEWVALLNNDAVPEEGFLSALVRRAAGDVAAVGGRIMSAGGTDVEFGGGGLNVFGFGFQRSSWQRDFQETAPGGEMPFACGGAMLARRDVFLDLGGFDGDYFAYYEDVDLGWRLNLAGHRVVYAPEARVRHRKHATSSRFSDRWRHFHWYKNTLQTLIKNSEAPLAARLVPAAFVLLLSRVGSFLETADQAHSRGDAMEARRFLDAAVGAGEGLSWVLTHADRVMAKRAAVQARRRVGDRVLEERFGFALDFGPETGHWPENARALELLALTDLSALLGEGRVAEALAERRRPRADAEFPSSVPAPADPLSAENARLRHEIDVMRKSLTWRLSGPFRRLLDLLRG